MATDSKATRLLQQAVHLAMSKGPRTVQELRDLVAMAETVESLTKVAALQHHRARHLRQQAVKGLVRLAAQSDRLDRRRQRVAKVLAFPPMKTPSRRARST